MKKSKKKRTKRKSVHGKKQLYILDIKTKQIKKATKADVKRCYK